MWILSTNNILYISGLTCGPHGLRIGWVVGYSLLSSTTMVIGNSRGKRTESIYMSSYNTNVESFCVGHSLVGRVRWFPDNTKQPDEILTLDPSAPTFDNNWEDKTLNKLTSNFFKHSISTLGNLGLT